MEEIWLEIFVKLEFWELERFDETIEELELEITELWLCDERFELICEEMFELGFWEEITEDKLWFWLETWLELWVWELETTLEITEELELPPFGQGSVNGTTIWQLEVEEVWVEEMFEEIMEEMFVDEFWEEILLKINDEFCELFWLETWL